MGAINKFYSRHDRYQDQHEDEAATAAGSHCSDNAATACGTMVLTQLDQTYLRNGYHRLVLVSENGGIARTFPLNHKRVHIGRSTRSSIRIEDPHVSVKHLTVDLADGVCVATDRNSTNGTFINGERLDDFQILNDGDEIMIGKTLLQYASRDAQTRPPLTAEPVPKEIATPAAMKKASNLPPNTLRRFITAMLMLAFALGVVSGVTYYLNSAKRSQLAAADLKIPDTLANQDTVETPSSQPSGKRRVAPRRPTLPVNTALIQNALDKYAAGQINSAMQALKTISKAVDNSPVALKARKILLRLRLVKELYRQALDAQDQEKFVLALERWDNLLQVDTELVGNRPSFFAVQAGLNVQVLSYKRALKAFQSKNNKKAKQLCHLILKIDSRNMDALKLLARIEAQASS